MGMLTAGHSHAGPLSFELVMNGRPVLVDPGTFTYSECGPWRNHFRRMEAHNCVQIDGEAWFRPAGPFRWEALDSLVSQQVQNKMRDTVSIAVRPNRPCGLHIHERTFTIQSANSLRVRDRFDGSGCHALKFWFHFAPGAQLTRAGDHAFDIVLEGCVLHFVLEGFRRCKFQVWEGSEEPVAGWFSPSFDHKCLAPVLCLLEETDFPFECAFRFELERVSAQ